MKQILLLLSLIKILTASSIEPNIPKKYELLDFLNYDKVLSNIHQTNFKIDKYTVSRISTLFYVTGVNKELHIAYVEEGSFHSLDSYEERENSADQVSFIFSIYDALNNKSDYFNILKLTPKEMKLDEKYHSKLKSSFKRSYRGISKIQREYAVPYSSSITLQPISELKDLKYKIKKTYVKDPDFGKAVISKYIFSVSGKEVYAKNTSEYDYLKDVQVVGFIQRKEGVVFLTAEYIGAKYELDVETKFIGVRYKDLSE